MCTLTLFRRPSHRWPVLIAANRDEMLGRPSSPPARHWPDRPNVTAGRDDLAGGSWLGLNDEGLVAAIMNRPGSLGPDAIKRTRGELVLEALDHAEAAAAAEALSHIDPQAYRPFNLILADPVAAFWLRSEGTGDSAVQMAEVPPGLSMFTAHDRNDPASARIATHLPRFEAATLPDPDAGEWTDWQRCLASRETASEGGAPSAMNITTEFGFGTVSSALIALPAPNSAALKPVWRYAAGRPDEAPFEAVELGP
ncbi:MAG: NRDE family protein [Alphaproteobacteria bacterium]